MQLTAALTLPRYRVPSLHRRHWPALSVLVTMLVLYLIAGFSVFGVSSMGERAVATVTRGLPGAVRPQTVPEPEPLEFRHVAPQDAAAFNAAIPLSSGPNPAARPFVQRSHTEADRARAVECLTAAIYYEAGAEPVDGQRAVAQVVLNRVRHPAFPNSVCGVVYQGSERVTGCQFTFTCDGSLRRTPSTAGWKRSREVAEAALSGKVYAPVGYATHYHTDWVVPYWSSSLAKVANIGAHIFYRWAGGWGKPPAFADRHSGTEPDLARAARLAAFTRKPMEGTEGATDAMAAEAAAEAGVGSIDSFSHAVLRRYEPATREGVENMVAAQTRNGDAVAASYRWALTGAGAGEQQVPLGQKAEATTPPAAAKPACLEGVKKAEAGADAPASPLAC